MRFIVGVFLIWYEKSIILDFYFYTVYVGFYTLRINNASCYYWIDSLKCKQQINQTGVIRNAQENEKTQKAKQHH